MVTVTVMVMVMVMMMMVIAGDGGEAERAREFGCQEDASRKPVYASSWSRAVPLVVVARMLLRRRGFGLGGASVARRGGSQCVLSLQRHVAGVDDGSSPGANARRGNEASGQRKSPL